MASYISIPKPCHEDWNNMSVESQGRHCLQCAKTVVDFTDWEATDIAAYLHANAATKVCGRLKTAQLNTPIEETPELYLKQIYFANVSIFKKIAAIFLIAFGFSAASCNNDVKGKVMGEPAAVAVDTVSNMQMGGMKNQLRPDTASDCEPIIQHTSTTIITGDIQELEPPGMLVEPLRPPEVTTTGAPVMEAFFVDSTKIVSVPQDTSIAEK
jgi:hypothetical protein